MRNFIRNLCVCFQGGKEAAQDSLDARQRQKGTACRTLHQYNKEPIPDEDMKKLLEIAEDYRRVKNYVRPLWWDWKPLQVISGIYGSK